MTTATQPTNAEAAQLLQQVSALLADEGDTSIPAQIRTLSARVEELKGLDPNKIAEEFERLKATDESITKSIRNTRDHAYVSGMEDIGDEFSMVRTLCARAQMKRNKGQDAKSAFEAVGAGLEFDLMRQSQEKMAKRFPNLQTQAHSSFDDQQIANVIPDQVIPDVIMPIYRRSTFINMGGDGPTRVRVVDGVTTGLGQLEFGGGSIGYWIGEEDPFIVSKMKARMRSATPKKIGVLTTVTEEMAAGRGLGFESLMRSDFAEAAQRVLDLGIMYGKGAKQITGIANTQGVRVYSAEAGIDKALSYVNDRDQFGNLAAVGDRIVDMNGATWAGGELYYDGLMNMGTILEEDDVRDEAMTTLGSPTYFNRLRQMRSEAFTGQIGANPTNAPYMLGAPWLTDAQLAAIIGPHGRSSLFTMEETVDGSTTPPTITKTRFRTSGQSVGGVAANADRKFSDVLRADLSAANLYRWNGVEIADDDGMGVGFASDVTLFKLRLRVDLHIPQPNRMIYCPDARTLS